MVSTITQPFQDYYNDLPEGTLSCVLKSAVYSFTINALLSKKTIPMILKANWKDFQFPLYAAACAALASLIHALTAPIFNKIFGDNCQDSFPREFIKSVLDICIVRMLVVNTLSDVDETIQAIRTMLPFNLFISIPHMALDLAIIMDGSSNWRWMKDDLHAYGWGAPNTNGSYLALG